MSVNKTIHIPFPKILQENEEEEQIENTNDIQDFEQRFEILDIIHICSQKTSKRKRSYSDGQIQPKRLRFDSL